MTRVAGLVVAGAIVVAGLLLAAVPLAGVAPGARNATSPTVSPYYLARGDPRLCPSPVCGGLFVRLVNRSRTICGDGLRRPQCYAARADLARLGVSERRRQELSGLLSSGRALARGTLVRGLVEGFPELDTFIVTEVWPASSSRRGPSGVFRRLRDNGVRCIAAPCFSIDALQLNSRHAGSRVTVSQIELSKIGATDAEQRRALRLVTGGDLIAVGRIAAVPRAGPAGAGRAFVASQLYTRAG